ncbi:hypothetical protein WA588_000734 [Blastocystis sp. NMH]
MACIEKLFLIAIISLLNDESLKTAPAFPQIQSSVKEIATQLSQLQTQMDTLSECAHNIPALFYNVMKEGVDADYDNSLRMTADCVQETRALYDTIADKIRSTYEENKSMLQTDIPEVSSIAIPSLSMTVDLSPLNEDRIVKGENALDYLTKLRAVYKRVSSVQSIAMKDSSLQLTMMEGYTVSVSLKVDSLNHYTITSATIEPSYPCFQKAIEYSIERNDIGLLADQTIYALYASKRLHKELEGLTDKAVITTDDDVHLTMTFKQGTVVKITIPEIYPNTFGMLKIDSVEGPRKDIESDLREKFFGDITAAVEYIYDTLSK